jgi:AcrR family transcriptional regulator
MTAPIAERLPPGRHGIAPEVVAENQRDRIFAAVCSCHREFRYAGVSVGDVSSRAGVSRATFYKLFVSKPACVAAAQEQISGGLRAEIAAAWAAPVEWPDRVDAALATTLSFCERAPEEALLLFADPLVGDPEHSRIARDFHRYASGLLRSGRGCSGDELPGLTEDALIGALRSVITTRLLAGLEAGLPDLKDELLHFVLAPYVGDGAPS